MPDDAATDGGSGSGARAEEAHPVETSPDGRYTRFDVVLGRGAFKTVYKAFDEREGIEVAWNQVIRSEPVRSKPEYDQLLHEITVLKKLKHKNIMTFYDSWVDRQKTTVNFITELFTSGTLRQYRQKHKKISESVLKRWAWQVLQGLVYLHGHDPPIIHRDLKCDNIFVNGSSGVVKIGDLGLATLVRYTTQPQSVLGTPEFMAPELYDEKYDEKVDVYSFGMCMLELTTLQYPYSECKNAAQIWKRVSTGIYPEGLKTVRDDDLRMFIQLCITHSSAARPEARKLLKHSFFESFRAEKEAEAQREGDSGLPALLPREPRSSAQTSETSTSGSDLPGDHVPLHGSVSSDTDGSSRSLGLGGFSSGAVGQSQGSSTPSVAPPRPSGEGGADDEDGIFVVCKALNSSLGVAVFELSVKQPGTQRKFYEFDYNLELDDKQTMMKEMQADLLLPSELAALVAELISTELDRVKSVVELGNFEAGSPESPVRLGFLERPASSPAERTAALPSSSNVESSPSAPPPAYHSALLLETFPLEGSDPSADSPRGYSAPLPPMPHLPEVDGRLSPFPAGMPPKEESLMLEGVSTAPSSSVAHSSAIPRPPSAAGRDAPPPARTPPPGLAPVIVPPAASAFESAHGFVFSSPGQRSTGSIPTVPSSSTTVGNHSRDGTRESSRQSSATLQWGAPGAAPVPAAASAPVSTAPPVGVPPRDPRSVQSPSGAPERPSSSMSNGLAPPRPALPGTERVSEPGPAVGFSGQQQQPGLPRGMVQSASMGNGPGLARQASAAEGDGSKVNRNLSLQDVRLRFQQFAEDTYAVGRNPT